MDSDDRRDVAALYCDLDGSLRRILQSNLTLSNEILDDACQQAWSRLATARGRVRRGAELPWLIAVATNEARKLLRTQRRVLSFGDVSGVLSTALDEGRPTAPDLAQLAEMRDRIGSLRRLPQRQQKIVWLYGLGYQYAEIGRVTGASRRTVERQLFLARRKLAC